MKKLLAFILCLALCLAPVYAAGAAMENFETLPRVSYTDGQFFDVDESAWYGAERQGVIKLAAELGIISGRDDGSFDPSGNLRVSEALKMACVVNSIYLYGSCDFAASGGAWYEVYVNYALEHGIISAGQFADYSAYATRAQMAQIFAACLPVECFSAKNTVQAVPDVSESGGAAIYLLYRAGVLTGDAGTGAFRPSDLVSRAEAAAIITRVALPAQRQSFELTAGYVPGQRVTDLAGLKRVYLSAIAELAPSMSVTTSRAVHDAYWDMLDSGEEWSNYAVKSEWISYDPYTGEMTIEFVDYALFYQVERLLARPALASRASAEAASELKRVQSLAAGIVTGGMTARDKLLALHDYMVKAYHYDLDFADESFSFTGLLNNGTGVCQAYAELYVLLAKCAGIDCAFVAGSASGGGGWESHAWNSVVLDGQTLYIDVTFDDPVPDTAYGTHDYFLVTADQLSKDHVW